MTFAAPERWPLLLLLALALVFGFFVRRRAERSTARWFPARREQLLGRPANAVRRGACALLAAGCAAVALLQPIAVRDGEPLGPDLVFCVDVSRSMAARDVEPSRCGQAIEQVEQVLDIALGARTALVAFAGEAQLRAPLTEDRAAVAWLVRELAPGALAPRARPTGTRPSSDDAVGDDQKGGTDLAAAIDTAARTLAGKGTRGEIVLLTDGEDFGDGAERAARSAVAAGHRVHCVAIGSPFGGKIVSADGESFVRDANGRDVITRPDRDALARIARAGNGSLLADAAAAALAAFYRTSLLPDAIARELPRRGGAPRFMPFLLTALAFWMLRACFPERR